MPEPASLQADLVDAAQEALYALRPDGTVLAWNWGAENLFGHTRQAAVGARLQDLIVKPEALAEQEAAVKECQATGSSVFEAVRRRADGGDVHVQAVYRWMAAGGILAASELDVTEGRRLQGELSQQVWSLSDAQEFLKSILESSHDYSIVAVDLFHRVLAWNAGARADFGVESEAALGQDAAALLVPPSSRAALVDVFAQALAAGRFEGEIEAARGATTFPARFTVSLRRDAYGSPVGFVLIVKDLREEKRAEEERRLALERLLEIRRLHEIDQVRTQLLNTASHELGTPLTPIKLNLKVLQAAQNPGQPPAVQRALTSLDRNVARLEEVVQGVLEAARIQGGTLAMQREPVDLDALLRLEAESMRDRFAQANVRLSVEAASGRKVMADRPLLSKAVRILLDNAAKFTPAGGHVDVESGVDRGSAVVQVRDSGIGIPPLQQARLFLPFSQLHDTMQQTRSGAGIGLYLAKGIVEGHGGRIWVESLGAGKGSTFAFTLPL